MKYRHVSEALKTILTCSCEWSCWTEIFPKLQCCSEFSNFSHMSMSGSFSEPWIITIMSTSTRSYHIHSPLWQVCCSWRRLCRRYRFPYIFACPLTQSVRQHNNITTTCILRHFQIFWISILFLHGLSWMICSLAFQFDCLLGCWFQRRYFEKCSWLKVFTHIWCWQNCMECRMSWSVQQRIQQKFQHWIRHDIRQLIQHWNQRQNTAYLPQKNAV